ncbi:mersacidin/lichenicidin family type 2 lantibiotic [Anabaena sp. CCY 0017]|uniref:mersacidin/lichenicidin family type 2 lantibiotic n=1 Tax=Anabaena sp. CCY 0017 TaxID=3103866 RepID=UPI0039C6F226
MSNIDIIRAWKDEDYRNSLSAEQRSQLPENPAGMVELTNTTMETIVGGNLKRSGETLELKRRTITIKYEICCAMVAPTVFTYSC